jgi:hypothetical protein
MAHHSNVTQWDFYLLQNHSIFEIFKLGKVFLNQKIVCKNSFCQPVLTITEASDKI